MSVCIARLLAVEAIFFEVMQSGRDFPSTLAQEANMLKKKIKEILDPQTIYKRSRCQHQYTQKVSMGCRLQAAGCRPQAAGCKLEATGSKRGATGPLGAQATSQGLRASCVGFASRIISVCWRAFRKR